MKRTINILASILANNVRNRYRLAEPDEAPFALNNLTAIIHANDFGDCACLEERDAATTLAAIKLEPKEGVVSKWVPRADMLSIDRDDDIETLAEIIARKAVVGYEPVPYQIVKECGETSSMSESGDLVAEHADRDDFTSETIYQQVFDRACSLLGEWNGDGDLWWPKSEPEPEPEPELPFADPPYTIISTDKDPSF